MRHHGLVAGHDGTQPHLLLASSTWALSTGALRLRGAVWSYTREAPGIHEGTPSLWWCCSNLPHFVRVSSGETQQDQQVLSVVKAKIWGNAANQYMVTSVTCDMFQTLDASSSLPCPLLQHFYWLEPSA